MPSFGQDLKREREVRGISLQEIAETTKISLRYLQALEEDQFELLPGKFLTRAIIRSYAQAIGLDPVEVLNQYLQLITKEAKEKEKIPAPEKKQILSKYNIRSMAIVIIIFSLALIIISWLVFHSPSLQVHESLSLTKLPSAQTTVNEVLLLETIVIPASAPMKLNLTFNQKTWLQIYADGTLKINGLLFPGDKVSLEAQQEFLLHIGNAGGFRYTLNNLPGRPLGKPGQVRKNLKINRSNYHQYLDLSPQSPTNLSNSSR